MQSKAITLLSTLLLTAGTTQVQADHSHSFTDYARVTHVEPLYKYVTVRKPQRHCEVIRPQRTNNNRRNNHRHSDNHNSTSAVIVGGVIGGAIGHHVTRAVTGSVNNAGTLAGAAIGSTIAQNAAERDNRTRFGRVDSHSHNGNHNDYDSHSHRGKPRKRCVTTTVETQERRANGFNVTYSYKGHTYYTRTDHNPGNRIKVTVQIKPH